MNTENITREQQGSSVQEIEPDVIRLIADTLYAPPEEIVDIRMLKKGMTNKSFSFRCGGKKYIMRMPGEGTGKLINRREEHAVYQTIQNYDISDKVCYMNPENGYKLTEYMEGVHVCDRNDWREVANCMQYLRTFHERNLKVERSFDLWGHIAYYESLWNGKSSIYRDYEDTRRKIFELKSYIEQQEIPWTLAHIDAVPDNFLMLEDGGIRLIDWEYAGMQDPNIDIAMFAVYSFYDREQVERLIAAYYPEGASRQVHINIYCYIAACGLLWSNWCEFKSQQGVEFGEYSLRQYQYAGEYYEIFQEELKCMK